MRIAEENPNGVPPLDPVRDFALNQLDLVEDSRRAQFLEDEIVSSYSMLDSIRFNSVVLIFFR